MRAASLCMSTQLVTDERFKFKRQKDEMELGDLEGMRSHRVVEKRNNLLHRAALRKIYQKAELSQKTVLNFVQQPPKLIGMGATWKIVNYSNKDHWDAFSTSFDFRLQILSPRLAAQSQCGPLPTQHGQHLYCSK